MMKLEDKKLQAIIFDLDGTLWDARENICKSWNTVLKKVYPQVGELTPESFTAQMGKLLSDIGDSLFPMLAKEDRQRAVDMCCEMENEYLSVHGGHLFEDELATIRLLAEKYKLFIVSNCQSGYIEAFNSSSGIKNYITDNECNGNTGLSKGRNIRLIMERNSIERAVYIGDTILDQQASDEANVPFIWAAYGFGTVDHYDARVDSFPQLSAVCKELEDKITILKDGYKWR